jgi:hypothetical protein
MYIRERSGKCFLATSYRNDKGQPRVLEAGEATAEEVLAVRAILKAKRLTAERQAELRASVSAIDQKLGQRFKEVLAQVKVILESRGYHNAKSQWRRRRKIFTSRRLKP